MAHRIFTTRLALAVACCLLLLDLAGCGEFHATWREQKLASGKIVKVTLCHLVWGVARGDRSPANDSLALEFVSEQSQASPPTRQAEAVEVFELIRPTSELWGLATATVTSFPNPDSRSQIDQFVFRRGTDGKWACTRN